MAQAFLAYLYSTGYQPPTRPKLRELEALQGTVGRRGFPLLLNPMTQPTINPYEPTAHTAAASQPREPLKFSGIIQRTDYQHMLPRDQEWWLFSVSLYFLAPIFVPNFSD